jgi:predicted TPR repeat methyltransferase
MIAGNEILATMLTDGYDAWAAQYDADMHRYGYRVPALMADAARHHIPGNRALLLDAGAGSGLVGRALKERGYQNLVGLDPSPAMLREARTKSVYGLVLKMTLSASAALADHRFDGILAAGVFKPGHAPPSALTDLVRLARPGGIIIFNLETGSAWARYDRLRRRLEAGRYWERLASTAPFAPLPGAAPATRTIIHVFRNRYNHYARLQPNVDSNQGI